MGAVWRCEPLHHGRTGDFLNLRVSRTSAKSLARWTRPEIDLFIARRASFQHNAWDSGTLDKALKVERDAKAASNRCGSSITFTALRQI